MLQDSHPRSLRGVSGGILKAERGEKRGPGSLKPPRWSAERRASRVMGRKAPRKRLASAWPAASCAGLTGASHAPERLSALRSPSIRVGEAKLQDPGADMRRGNEMGCLTS